MVPEFMYEPTYDEKHRAQVVDVVQERAYFEQKGLRERLLCAACEGRVGAWERHAADVYRRIRTRVVEGSEVTVHDVEYRPFRLFQLSMFWRASVASGPAFSTYTLGPHEEPIGAILLSEGDPPADLYPTVPMVLPNPGRMGRTIAPVPQIEKVKGQRVSYWFVTGLVWTLVTSSHLPARSSLPVHREDGALVVPVAPVSGEEMFRDWVTPVVAPTARREAEKRRSDGP